ncbi:MAG TPA: ATP-binding protein [Pseudoneobacillus sp.]|nr:ATP-binding protein [Pseudoneobacillus sp.]
MEQRTKAMHYLNDIIEKKGSLILNLFCFAIGMRVFFEMSDLDYKIIAIIFTATLFLASFYRKKSLLFYPLITTSTLLLTILIIFSKLDFFTLLSLANNFLIISAFLLPNPFANILFGAVFTSLLLTYQDSLSFYFIKGSIIGVAVNTVFYSLFAYLIRYLYQKKVELQESEKNNQLLLNLLPDPLTIHQNGQIIFVNNEALRLMGAASHKELVGKSLLSFIQPEYHEAVLKRMASIHSESQSNIPLEVKVKNFKQDIIDIEVTGVPINYQGSPAILTIARDITAIKTQTAELIQQSDKLSLVGQLAAGIAHEIRNPLTSLRGFIQLLQYKSEENKDYCHIMLSELDRINLIVGEFLILAKPHMVKFSQKDINSIIRHVGTLIGTQAIINNIHVDYQLAKGLPYISCEENQLKQVIINLIKNAIEAMPDGGTIKVETGKYDENNIFIRVIDEGKGIPSDKLAKLGEPFYTTKENGTGLGLMVCYKIIENHLGQLNVHSELNEGTTFEIILRASFVNRDFEVVSS